MWKHWITGEEWSSEADYIYHIVMLPHMFTEEANRKRKLYYEKLRNDKLAQTKKTS